LSCPIGSVLCGSNDFINEAKRWRKMLGGGMRQAGVFAAAGIVALNSMIDRMAEDHENAHLLAKGISQIVGLTIDMKRVQTNIIYFGLNSSKLTGSLLVTKMENKGLNFFETSPNRFRMVTHYGITKDCVKKTLQLLKGVLD